MNKSTPEPDTSRSDGALVAMGQLPVHRVQVLDVWPTIEGGRWPIKSVVGEQFAVSAKVFREGHDHVGADLVTTSPSGQVTVQPMREVNHGLCLFQACAAGDEIGLWHFQVRGWADPWGTWLHAASIKIPQGVDSELMTMEGANILLRAAAEPERSERDRERLNEGAAQLTDRSAPATTRFSAIVDGPVNRLLGEQPVRDFVSASQSYRWLVESTHALYGSWYEIFPRSEGAVFDESTGEWRSGTLLTAAERLPAIAALGFDVVYLTPIHPIGTTHRKGKNNSKAAAPGDPGSPYAIGSSAGGHEAVHPELGTLDDLRTLVRRASGEGLRVAMDIALNASPDHPWVNEHPEFFDKRADGSIAFSENPPKKYEDIYPLSFDSAPEELFRELRKIIEQWIECGVHTFRVDNPHTKPVEFWQRLIAEVNAQHANVVWLSEAFTRPPMMHVLAKVGFQQSYTYFAWRNTVPELTEYLNELAYETPHFLRPNLWPTTHDILTPYLQRGGVPGHVVRVTLAATMSPAYGIYSGYEHVESVARAGAEEHVDNEKYEYKSRQWHLDSAGLGGQPNLGPTIAALNQIRREHPSLHWLRNITFHQAEDPDVIVYSKHGGGVGDGSCDDTLIVVANLDPTRSKETWIHLDVAALGEDFVPGQSFEAVDLLWDELYDWTGLGTYVRLTPERPVHVVWARSR